MYTVASHFLAHAEARPFAPFLCVPPDPDRAYLAEGAEFTYGESAARVLALSNQYRKAELGHGHRVALLLENRPDFFWHLLALNALGVSIVPINPDFKSAELRYLFEHAEPHLLIVLEDRYDDLTSFVMQYRPYMSVLTPEQVATSNLSVRVRDIPRADAPSATTEAALLYTSGTTGRPKGCILSNRYLVSTGLWYSSYGGRATFRFGQDRLYSTVPLFHMAGLALATMGVIASGGCLIQPERFRPRRLWKDAVATDATILHYLGVVLTTLLKQAPIPEERQHSIRFGLGAGGGDPALRAAFEERFSIELCEGWGMTETGRSIFNAYPPYHKERYNFGRAIGGLEAAIVDDQGNPVPAEQSGELVVRFAGSDARYGFFSGYLKDDEATEEAWRGGWFHTGDVGAMMSDGTICFVDRKKNIIRRSGENIAASEVEAILDQHPCVERAGVVHTEDAIREQEVLAFIQLRNGIASDGNTAESIFEWCMNRMAYFKAPGWVCFVDEFPMTASNKIIKAALLEMGKDPVVCGAIDFRSRKQRPK